MTNSSERQVLKYAARTSMLSFSETLKIARFDFYDHAFFVTCGFDFPEPPAEVRAVDLDAGLLTVFLSEASPEATASPVQIRNVVETGDMTAVPDYKGHDPDLIATLYPAIRVFDVADLSKEESFRTFFLICLAERRRTNQWIDQELAATLNLVAGLSPASVPYEILCRSVLDMDPTALFLALYRCLEALYAHTQSQKLMKLLGFSKPWAETALALEEALGWHPREETSLESLLIHAVEDDLRAIVHAMSLEIPQNSEIKAFAAKKIYSVRNALVHYRPFQQQFPFSKLDWNRVCEAMSLLVLHIYSEISPGWASLSSLPSVD